MDSQEDHPPLSARRFRLLKNALPDYEKLKVIGRAATLDLGELFSSIEFHERGIAGIQTDIVIVGRQFLSEGRSLNETGDRHQFAADWTQGFLDTVAEWKNKIPDYAEGVKTYELFRKSIPEDVRMNAAEILSRRQNPAYEPGFTLELLRGIGFDAPLFGQIEAHLQLRRIFRLLFGRHSSGVTPQSSKKWPGHVTANNDPLGLYSGNKVRPNLAFFSRRDHLKPEILKQPDGNAAHWEIDPDLPVALYLDRVCENHQTPESWTKLVRPYYSDPNPKRGLMLKGLAEVEELIKKAKLDFGSPIDVIEKWRSDLRQWRHVLEEAETISRELQFLEWRYRPTLCAANAGRGHRYVGVEGDLSPSLRAIARWLISGDPIQDIFTPGEIAADWKSTVDLNEKQKAEKRAARLRAGAHLRRDIINEEMAKLENSKASEIVSLDPQREEILRRRRERKDRQKLAKKEARLSAMIERQNLELIDLSSPSPDRPEVAKAIRKEAKDDATKRRLQRRNDIDNKIKAQARLLEESKKSSEESAAAKKSALKDSKPRNTEARVKKQKKSPAREVPASREEWAALRAARRVRHVLRRRSGL